MSSQLSEYQIKERHQVLIVKFISSVYIHHLSIGRIKIIFFSDLLTSWSAALWMDEAIVRGSISITMVSIILHPMVTWYKALLSIDPCLLVSNQTIQDVMLSECSLFIFKIYIIIIDLNKLHICRWQNDIQGNKIFLAKCKKCIVLHVHRWYSY